MQTSPKTLLQNILFLDIETVSCVEHYEEMAGPFKPLWDKKAKAIGKKDEEDVSDFFFERAAIYAEYGKVIVIGLGFVVFDENDRPTLRVKALQGHDERAVLQTFGEMLERDFPQKDLRLCAHNGKEFDFPYLCRRMLVHGIPLPNVLNVAGKKPWEVAHIDTMELWKFGDRKSFTSLHLLATLFGITSSKELMAGSDVNHYYYKKHDLAAISAYCLQDVVVLVQIFLKMHCCSTIPQEAIVFASTG